ncbi:unnamed protein product [Clavelina lepadiformis]|uniref:Dipeptidyl peptidase 4 n=1 Tax=Clavelina lepadiformis TaxID=159417 RepID=A0ABP0F0Z4_CLALP
MTSETQVLEFAESDVQYITWSPTGHGVTWVRNNDLYYIDDVSKYPTGMVRITHDGSKNQILNGLPDWVYEEEMVFTTNNIFWSPDSRFLAYLVTNDTLVDKIEYSVYGDFQYPDMVEVAYPKAGSANPTVSMKLYMAAHDSVISVAAPVELVGSEHLFSRFYWHPDSNSFIIYWMNRISNKTVPQLCKFNSTGKNWNCSVVQAGLEESQTGWIGNGGTPFDPIMRNDGSQSYFTIMSDAEGYWHIAFIETTAETPVFLTTGANVVVSLRGYDADHDWLYFVSAYPLPRKRQLYRIKASSTSVPFRPEEWDCLTCGNDFDDNRCQWINPGFSPTLKYLVVNCGGPDVPMTTIQLLDADGNYGPPEVVVNNDDLIANKASVKWPIKEYGEIDSQNGIKILYQLHKPMDFDASKKYPLLIEVYGGPGFQKVQDRWTRSWAPIHMVSQYDVIVVSLDARGSGYRGDGIAHMLYKKIGQLEKVDTTEVGSFFAAKPWIDETKMAVWGWSYGGYTTTFTISEGAEVFKCGFAVAPLATRFLYDSIHTERYMTLPEDNVDGYEKCSILNSDLENFKKASYSIIHGTADDNVHFQNAALISKALIEANVDFDNFYYADEAHSVNYGPNSNRHIYKLLTSKVRRCFDLPAPEMNSDVTLTLKQKKKSRSKSRFVFQDDMMLRNDLRDNRQ